MAPDGLGGAGRSGVGRRVGGPVAEHPERGRAPRSRSEAEAAGVAPTVLVQTVTVAAETPELLALAAADPLVAGVVGWTDLTAPTSPAYANSQAGNDWWTYVTGSGKSPTPTGYSAPTSGAG